MPSWREGDRVLRMAAEETRAVRGVAAVEGCVLGREWLELGGPAVLQVTQGELLVGAGEGLERAVAGDFVSVPPGARGRVRAAQVDARAERLEIDAELAGRVLEACAVTATESAGPTVDRRGTDRARQAARLLRGIAAAQAGSGAARLRCAGLCVELLALIADSEPSAPRLAARRGHAPNQRFRRAVAELRDLPLDEISLPLFARRAGLSPRHASRLFQRELGVSFREHVGGLRLERAKALLRDTGMTVIEVAGETGWSSLAHFNAVFRRRVGATPSRYRSGGESPPRSPRATRRATACSQAPRQDSPA